MGPQHEALRLANSSPRQPRGLGTLARPGGSSRRTLAAPPRVDLGLVEMSRRPQRNFDNFLRGLKRLIVDFDPDESGAYTNGPMTIRHYSFLDDKHKERRGVRVESRGWDHNYGGWVAVEASPTGKSIQVIVSPEIRVRKEPRQ